MAQAVASTAKTSAAKPVKTGLVLEGGAMRGMFTCGVLDVLMEQGVDRAFAGAIGVSAGVAFGSNIKSHQIGRAIRYNKKYCGDKRYWGLDSLVRTGNLFNVEFCYHTIPEQLDPWDQAMYAANPLRFYAVATDMNTGEPVYHDCSDDTEFEWFRASASMPGLSTPVEIDGRQLSDGGTSDSIPLKYFESIDYTRNVVVLTQPRGFVKEQAKNFSALAYALRKYPALVDALRVRPQLYNLQTAYVAAREKAGAAFVIAPPEALNIAHATRDANELERVYQMGRAEAEKQLPALKAWLGLPDNADDAQFDAADTIPTSTED